MFQIIIRIMLVCSGVITGWFVAEDTETYKILNLFIAILLVVLSVAMAAYWHRIVAYFRRGHEKNVQ